MQPQTQSIRETKFIEHPIESTMSLNYNTLRQFPSVDIDIKFWITIMITTWFWQVHLTFQNENCLVRILSRSLLTDWPYGKCPRLCLCLWTESRKVLQLRRLLTVRIASINGTSVHSYFLSTLTSFSMKQSSFGILISHPCGAYMLAAPWPGTAWNRMNFCFNAHTLTGENGWVSPERQLMFLHQSGQPSSADTWLPMTHEWSCSRQIPKSKIVLAHGLYYWYTVYIYVHDAHGILVHRLSLEGWQLTVDIHQGSEPAQTPCVNVRRQPDWISG